MEDLSTSGDEMSTLEINVMADKLQECLSRFPRIQILKAQQIESLEALLAADRVWKEPYIPSLLPGKTLFEPESECSFDFTAQQYRERTSQRIG